MKIKAVKKLVWYSVENSVYHSVNNTVWNSVWDSVRDLVYDYLVVDSLKVPIMNSVESQLGIQNNGII